MKENEKSMRTDYPPKADQQQGNQAEGKKKNSKLDPIQEEIYDLKQQKRQVSRELNQVRKQKKAG